VLKLLGQNLARRWSYGLAETCDCPLSSVRGRMLGARRFADDDSQAGQAIFHRWNRGCPAISVSCLIANVNDEGPYLNIV
jgi:hypothetical protein